MRTYCLKTIVVCFFALQGFAQKKEDITVNFLSPTRDFTPSLDNLNHGTKYKLTIKDVNLNIYKVEGSVTQTDNNTDLPAIFTGVKLPAFLNLSLPETETNTVVNSLVGGSSKDENLQSRFDSLKILVEDSKNLYNRKVGNFKDVVDLSVDLSNTIKNLTNDCNNTYDQIEKNLVAAGKIFLGGTATADRKTQIDAIAQKLNTVIKEAKQAKETLDISIEKQLEITDALLASRIIKLEGLEKINNSIDDTLKVLGAIRRKTQKQREDIKGFEDRKANNLKEIKLLPAAIQELKDYKDALIKLIEKANGSIVAVNDFNRDNKIQELVNAYNTINFSNFNYVSDEIEVDSDEVKFDFKVVPNKIIPCDVPPKVSISKTYTVKGGFKIDFSTGVFFNFGKEDFLGRDIQYKAVNDSVSTIQSKDGGKRSLMSVGALMHLYFRSGNNFNLALSPGLSLTSGLDALNFHLGVSGIFGKKQRIVVTLGTTLKQSKILDKNYLFDTQYPTKKLPKDPPTISVFPKWGLFFGITYNFSKLKKQG